MSIRSKLIAAVAVATLGLTSSAFAHAGSSPGLADGPWCAPVVTPPGETLSGDVRWYCGRQLVTVCHYNRLISGGYDEQCHAVQ
jgi:hypothetical protein